MQAKKQSMLYTQKKKNQQKLSPRTIKTVPEDLPEKTKNPLFQYVQRARENHI